MSQSPRDDRELISFLQQYRPLPPSAPKSYEHQLFAKILSESQHHPPKRLKWLIPSAIAAALMAVWGGYSLLQPSPYQQFVRESNELNTRELEDFMVNTWQETTYASTQDPWHQPAYSQWLSLGNLETQYVISSP